VRRQIDHPSVAATLGTPVEAATALWILDHMECGGKTPVVRA